MGVLDVIRPQAPPRTRTRLQRRPPEAEAERRFDAWLSAEVRVAPGIIWRTLPASVKFYLWNTVDDSPDGRSIALAAALVCRSGITETSSITETRLLHTLLRRLRQDCGLTALTELGERAIWDQARATYARPRAAAGERSFPPGIAAEMGKYQSVTDNYVRAYAHELRTGPGGQAWQEALDALSPSHPLRWQDLLLPSMPPGWWSGSGIQRDVAAEAEALMLTKTDVLLRLHTPLSYLAVLRHRALKSLVLQYRRELARARRQGTFPWHFTDEIVIPSFAENAPSTVAEVRVVARRVTLSLAIWDRPSWARAHWGRVSEESHRDIEQGKGAYAPALNGYYLEVLNAPEDFFWCGRILAEKGLGHPKRTAARRIVLERLGEPRGFHTTRPGLLDPALRHAHWFRDNVRRGEMLFDLEALYRGVLYGATLAVAALTSAPRVSELLQFSDLRWDEFVVPLETPTSRPRHVLVQMVLTKRHRTEAERLPKLIGPDLQPLLREITRLLERHHGGRIPIIQPTTNLKREHLGPEPYLFQWDARADGTGGLLNGADAAMLLRFLFYGIELRTMRGERFSVGVHLCRHATASKMAEDGLTDEEIAVLLTHVVSRRTPSAVPVPSTPTTRSYDAAGRRSRALQGLARWHQAVAVRTTKPPMVVPTEEHLAQMDQKVRAVLDRYGLMAATALGWCSAGLCVRDDRRQCVGCPFLVEDYRMLGYALRLRRVLQVELDLAQSAATRVDIAQKQHMIEDLEGHIHAMRVQGALAGSTSRDLPAVLRMPLPTPETEAGL